MYLTDYLLKACYAVHDDPSGEDREACDKMLTKALEIAARTGNATEGEDYLRAALKQYRANASDYPDCIEST